MTIASSIRADSDFLMHDAADAAGNSFSLMDLLTIQADANPARSFLVSGDDPLLTFTFAQAHDAVSRLTAFLQALKLPQGSRIGLLLSQQPLSAIALLACTEAGQEPLLLRGTAPFSDLSAMIARSQCTVLIADQPANAKLAEMAARLAAAHDTIRFVMAFGSALPNGVIALDTALHALPASAPSTHSGSVILLPQITGRPIALSIAALIATATEHAAETGITSDMRIIVPYPTHSLPALCCGVITALMTGAELYSLDAPDSAALTQAFVSQRPLHLIWPSLVEDMLDDIPAQLLTSATLMHRTPWEKQRHLGMTETGTLRITDAWLLPHSLIAFAQRQENVPSLPMLLEQKILPEAGALLVLHADTNGALLAAGRCVHGYDEDAPQWFPLGCSAFRDHRGALVALDIQNHDSLARQERRP